MNGHAKAAWEGDDVVPLREGESGDRYRDAVVDGRYRIVGRIGHGGMGVVFRAIDTVLDRAVALKVLGDGGEGQLTLARFRKEARALAQIRHENVVKVYAFGEHLGGHYIAMEHVAGRDLQSLVDEHLARAENIPLDRALTILRGVAGGLDAIHASGLVHRDVKPSNILLEARTERPVLIDFGLARERIGSTAKLSCIGGTPSYMAPEQVNDGRISARTDQYGLACTAFEILTGRPVFDRPNGLNVMLAHVHEVPPRISTVRPHLRSFDPVVARALSKRPEDRYDRCETFVDALTEAALASGRRAPRRIRVMLLTSDEHTRMRVETVAQRALRSSGDRVQIERLDTALDLANAFGREAADVVLVDDASASGDTEALVEGLRHAPRGHEAEVLVLNVVTSSPRLADLGARELPRPLHTHVLGLALARVGARLAERHLREPS